MKATGKLRVTPNFKVFLETYPQISSGMTLKNDSAKYHSSNRVFCNSVRYLWAVYIKSANYSKVPD